MQVSIAFGNDGNHFNVAINTGANSAVSVNVANALHDASDHLPVFADFVIGTTTSVLDSELPKTFNLNQNYPNPFNLETSIRFTISKDAQVTLTIFDVLGREIRTLSDYNYQIGSYFVIWDGMDNNGNLASNGLYLYRIQVGSFSLVMKMALLR